MTDNRTFFPASPDIGRDPYHGLLGSVAVFDYVLLTAADGIDCSFMLLAADMTRFLDESTCIRVQTVSSDAGGKWGPVSSAKHRCPWWCMRLDSYHDAPVVLGGVVHWLMHVGVGFIGENVREYILTYNISTAMAGSIDLPKDRRLANYRGSGSQLGSSPDGKLSFIVSDRFMVSVWVLSGGSWARQAEIDMEATWSSLLEHLVGYGVELENFGDQRSGAVFLRLVGGDD